jgi:hypothetical protein
MDKPPDNPVLKTIMARAVLKTGYAVEIPRR